MIILERKRSSTAVEVGRENGTISTMAPWSINRSNRWIEGYGMRRGRRKAITQ
jgi:hypothetical protein